MAQFYGTLLSMVSRSSAHNAVPLWWTGRLFGVRISGPVRPKRKISMRAAKAMTGRELMRLVAWILAAAAVPGAAPMAQSGGEDQGIRPAPAFSASALARQPTDAWPTNGGNLYNQRYSPLGAIDPVPTSLGSRAFGAPISTARVELRNIPARRSRSSTTE